MAVVYSRKRPDRHRLRHLELQDRIHLSEKIDHFRETLDVNMDIPASLGPDAC